MDATRRRFLEMVGAGLAAWAVLPVLPASAKPRYRRLMGFGKSLDPSTREPAHWASVADLDAGRVRPMRIPFFGHGCTFDPSSPRRAFVFEKRGPGCCLIDWQAEEVLRVVPPRKGCSYYGHGAWSADGKQIFVAETVLKDGEGLVVVLDRSGNELGTFPTYGRKPHDLQLVDDGRVLVIANAGGTLEGEAPSVTYVDVRTQRLLDRTGPGDPLVNLGHVGIGKRGDLVMVSAPREGLPDLSAGGVALRRPGGLPAQMPSAPIIPGIVGEALSVCIDETRRLAAVTHPSGGILTFWDLDAQRLRSIVELPSVRGVVHAGDDRHLVASHGPGALSLISWDSLSIVRHVDLSITPFSGSHLYQLPIA